MLFADIPGQEEVKQKLLSSVQNNQVAHAQMFLGKPGSANLALALAYTTYLNCDNPGLADACGECPACSKSKKFIHPDQHYVFPVSPTAGITGKDAVSSSYLAAWRDFLTQNPYGMTEEWSKAFGGENKSLNISKEESRNIIRDLSLKSFEGKYKTMIIWQPEYLHISAANGILKVLEEPPENTVFILVAYDHERLLTTILSRTQSLKIPLFKDDEITATLISRFDADENKARQVAHLASGNMNEAFKLINEVVDDSRGLFHNWMRNCYSHKFAELVKMSDEFAKTSKVAQRGLFDYGMNIMRECLVYNAGIEQLNRLTGDDLTFVQNFGKVLNEAKIESTIKLFNNSAYHLDRNASAKILFMSLSLKVAQILNRKAYS